MPMYVDARGKRCGVRILVRVLEDARLMLQMVGGEARPPSKGDPDRQLTTRAD